MILVRRLMLLVLVPAASHAIAAPVPASAPARMSLTSLKQLETGLWQLDIKGRTPKQLCMTDPMTLVQIEHDQPGCSRFLIANDLKSATVHYSCQRAGWGRTTVRVENPRAAAIQTQGIARNAPFDYSVQAKRLRGCDTQVGSRQR